MHALAPAHPMRRVAAALAAGLVLVVVGALAAGAQVTDEGHIEIEASQPAGGTNVHIVVRVTDKRDDPGNDAVVTAAPLLVGGEEFTPVRLSPADHDGRYEGVVPFPDAGRYTLRITTVGPDARIERPVTVTVSASTTPTSAAPGQTTLPVPDSTLAATGGGAAASDDGGGVPTGAVALLTIVVVAGATAAVVLLRRARAAGEGAAGDGSTAEDGEAGEATGAGGEAPGAGEGDEATGGGSTTGAGDAGDAVGDDASPAGAPAEQP